MQCNTPAQKVTAVETQAPGTVVKMLSFRLGRDAYCIHIADAVEVVELTALTVVPYLPPFIRGATNLRGRIITVVDVNYFLTDTVDKINHDARMMIVDMDGDLVGLVIDKVLDTFNVPVDEIQPPLPTLKGEIRRCVKGQVRIDEQTYVVLDIKALLTNRDMMTLSSA